MTSARPETFKSEQTHEQKASSQRLFRRLQSGRCEPLVHVQRGFGPVFRLRECNRWIIPASAGCQRHRARGRFEPKGVAHACALASRAIDSLRWTYFCRFSDQFSTKSRRSPAGFSWAGAAGSSRYQGSIWIIAQPCRVDCGRAGSCCGRSRTDSRAVEGGPAGAHRRRTAKATKARY